MGSGYGLIVGLFLALAPGVGAEPGLRLDSFRRFSVEDGLPHSRVLSIQQDSRGFLWVGTQNGLARFDGYEFQIHENRRGDPNSLAENFILDLYADGEGSLWVGTNGGGLDRLDLSTGKFHHHRHEAALSDSAERDKIGQIQVGPERRLWLSTSGGVSFLEPESGHLVPWEAEERWEAVLGEEVLSLFWDSRGDFWLVGNTAVLRLRDGQAVGDYRLDLRERQRMGYAQESSSLTEDSRGQLWFWGQWGLSRLDLEKGSLEPVIWDGRGESFLGSDGQMPSVWGLTEDREGSLWIGVSEQGVARLDASGAFLEGYRNRPGDPHSLSHEVVFDIFEDRTGVLWFGTNGGLDQLAPQRTAFARYGPDPSQPEGLAGEVLSIHQDSAGGLWVGTLGHGLMRIDAERQNVERFQLDPADPGSLVQDYVWSIYEDREGRLWVGTESGLDRFDRTRRVFRHYRHDEEEESTLTPGRVLTFLERGEDLWVGTSGGLNRMDRRSGNFERYLWNPESWVSVLALVEGPEGFLWAGTDGHGLFRVDPQSGEAVAFVQDPEDPDSLSHNVISALQWLEGELWVATIAGGLDRFDPRTGDFVHYRKEDGLPSNYWAGLQVDDEGTLWLSNKLGIVHFDPVSGEHRSFDVQDGLPAGGFGSRSSYRSPEGELFFGGIGGFVAFFPEDVRQDSTPAQVAITGLEIQNQRQLPRWQDPDSPLERPIEATDQLVLQSHHRSVSFELAALHFANPERNRLAYRLEGFDADWMETGADKRFVTYSNLAPGFYTLHVRAASQDGLEGEGSVQLGLRVLPPLWRTWWAKTLYALLAALLLLTFVASQRRKVARERAINEQLRQVDRLKDEFLANTSHELRTPLHGMVGLAESLVDGIAGELPSSARDDLRRIVSSGRRLGHLVDDLQDFSRLRQGSLDLHPGSLDLSSVVDVVATILRPVAVRDGLELSTRLPEDLPSVLADENRLQQILYNLVGNGIKFTESGGVEITAARRGDLVEVRVQDTGPGIASEDQERIFESFERAVPVEHGVRGTGLGLAITRKLVELHGGTLGVESSVGTGSTFFFTLPVASEGAWTPAGRRSQATSPLALGQEEALESSLVRAERGDPRRPRLLVVDDEEVNRRVLRNHLELGDYRVVEVESGEGALARLEQGESYDLVLLDVMMPGLSGFEVCRRLRKTFPRQELPVIFLTARSRDEDLAEGLTVGANDYLLKPTSRAELMSRVALHLDLLAAHRHLDHLLEEKAKQVKILGGLLPMCASCKKIRDDEGYWNEVEAYLSDHSEAEVSHGLCPKCMEEYYPEFSGG